MAFFSRTTRVSRYQKGKTNLDFSGARDSEWQWHQLGHMQVCTSLQTDDHACTPPLCFFTDRMPFLPPNQQRQSTEGTDFKTLKSPNLSLANVHILLLSLWYWWVQTVHFSVTLQSKFWMSASRVWLFVDNFGAWKMQFGSLKSAWILYFEFATNPDFSFRSFHAFILLQCFSWFSDEHKKISSQVKFQVTVWVVYCYDCPLFGRMMRAWLSTYSTCVNFSWISTNLTSRLSPQHLHGVCASWLFCLPRLWCMVQQRVVSVHWKVSNLASEPTGLSLIVWV